MARRILPLLKKKRFIVFLLMAVLLQWAYRTLEFRLSDEAFIEIVEEAVPGTPVEVHYKSFDDRKIRYVEVGDSSDNLIVFIHGAPSSSAFWQELLTDTSLLAHSRLLAVDRPGYGYSGFGKPEISVARQAYYIGEILCDVDERYDQIVLHGSSYGGTVAARLAMDYPELVDGLLLQSASLAPGEERTYWISYPTSHWTLSWMIPATLHVANKEKLNHREQLLRMKPLWDRIRSATIILQGTADELIYPINAQFAHERLKNAAFVEKWLIPGRGHDLLWNEPGLIRQSLLKLLQREETSIQMGMRESNH